MCGGDAGGQAAGRLLRVGLGRAPRVHAVLEAAEESDAAEEFEPQAAYTAYGE